MSDTVGAYDPNLNYQFYAGMGGGSDSNSKLKAIQLPNLAGKRFLDLGCNAGFFCAYASNSGASRVLGVDNSSKVIRIARERYPHLAFLDTGWDRFPEGEFDVVICLSAIHYAANQIRLAQDIWSHLSAEGLFVLEGGLIDDQILKWTDLPVVAFREVADRVRHLSTGFLGRHMLVEFDWSVIGSSVLQGGDPIPRSVIHARKTSGADPFSARPSFRLCPIEYAKALALSAPTIQDNQPSCDYVKALGASGRSLALEQIARVLTAPDAIAAFADDVAYALKGHGKRLELNDSLGEELTLRLAALLRERQIETTISSETKRNMQSAMVRMEAGVEFTDGSPAPSSLARVLKDCALADAKVADLSGRGSTLWRNLLDAGVRECHLIDPEGAGAVSLDPRVRIHCGQPGRLVEDGLDFVFFDATLANDFDHVNGTTELAEGLMRHLAPDGQAYLVLRTGVVQTDWDVFNPVLLTPIGRLPGSQYLYDVLFREFAVRPLIRLVDKANAGYSVTRIFRVRPRRPTLMVVLGHSQAGKTTLARCLRHMPDAVHLSSDYIFFELFRFRSMDSLPSCSKRLLEVVGGGSAEEVGNFFRTIESDPELFQDYLSLVVSMIPQGRRVVSLDLDLRQLERVDELKSFLTKAGFSVWIVTR